MNLNKREVTHDKKANIVLLMNHKENRSILKDLLVERHTILTTIDKNWRCSPDLIIIDEFALNKYINQIKEIKKRDKPNYLPLILITSNSENELLYKDFSTILDDIIRIPVGKNILLNRISNLLDVRYLTLESYRKYHELVEKSPVGVCILQKEKIVYINPSLQEMMGKSRNELEGLNFYSLINKKDHCIIADYFKFNTENRDNIKKPYEIRLKSNKTRWVNIRMAGIIYQGNSADMIILNDITEKKKSVEKIKYLSFHDKMTGLYNRDFFEEELKRLNSQRQLPLAVIMVDINGLKLVNDAFGHKEGNKLLKRAADVIETVCRKEDIVSRWGGDEFAILLPGTSKKDCDKICNRIKKASKNSSEKPIELSLAMGGAVKNKKEENIEKIIKTAEDRMYRNKLAESKNMKNTIIDSLESTLQEKTYETIEHAERMENIAVEIAAEIKLSESVIDELKLLARLHDIGKVSIPENILKKPGKLTKEEFKIIKSHPESGYRIVKEIPELARVAEAILSHHENWDGSGYPRGLKGDEIPYISRVIAIVDSYDVMTHKRAYKEPISKSKALKEIRNCSGQQFDPGLVNVFTRIIS